MAVARMVTESSSISFLASRTPVSASASSARPEAALRIVPRCSPSSNSKATSIAARLSSISRLQESELGQPSRRHAQRLQPFRVASGDGSAVAVEPVAEPMAPIETRIPEYPTILDINQIREILPHRFPFLLVDRVVELEPGKTVVAIKNVTINDNFFPGHFPERPIMPGVLMIEAMAQVGGIAMLNPEVGGSKESFFFAGVDKVRFRKPVVAGDTLVMRMNVIKVQKRFGIAKMEGKAYVGGQVVCEGEFLMALGS